MPHMPSLGWAHLRAPSFSAHRKISQRCGPRGKAIDPCGCSSHRAMPRPRQETPPRTQGHGRREGQQLGRTRYRERHGSTGRTGRSKAEERLAGRFFIDDLLCCGSLGQSWHQPHRGGDVHHRVVKRTGDVNPAVWADASRLQVPAEGCGWHRARRTSVSVFGRYRCSDGREEETDQGTKNASGSWPEAFVSRTGSSPSSASHDGRAVEGCPITARW